MDYSEIQSPPYGSQASEGSSSIPPQAPRCRIYNFSDTTSQFPQHDSRPGSQSMPSGRPRLLPELSSWPAHRPDPQCPQPSAPPLQASSSVPPFPYAPCRTQEDLASLESQTFQQYTASDISNQYSLPSSYFEAITPSDHPISHQRYGGEVTTTSFKGVERSHSGHGWRTYNGDGSPLTSMDATIVQGSSIEPYNLGAEQGNEQGPVVLSGMGSWGSRRVPGEANVSDNYHRSDGLTVNPSQIWNPVPMEYNPAGQNQGTQSQEIGYPVDPSALGIDLSLQPPYFSEVHGSFVEDANNTNTDACNSQNERYPHDPGYFGNHWPSNPSAWAPRYAPESRNILSSTASNLPPLFDHGAHSQIALASSESCQFCDWVFSNGENRRRHMREQHEGKVQYKCLLSKDGLVCRANFKSARNRRRHVKTGHPRESRELPPTSTNRRPNEKTDEMLNGWFAKVL